VFSVQAGLAGATLALIGVFWFASRNPQLLGKAQHLGQEVPGMAYAHAVLVVAVDAPLWQRILYGAANWLADMRIGILGSPEHSAVL
jgi:hypothetical protein